MKVLALRSGGFGSDREIEGLISVLQDMQRAAQSPFEVCFGSAMTRHGGMARPLTAAFLRSRLARQTLRKHGCAHPFMSAMIEKLDLPNGYQPDVVLSNYKPRALPGAMVSALFKAHWLHVRELPRYWNGLCTSVLNRVVTKDSEVNDRHVDLDFYPTRIRWHPYDAQSPLAAIFIGGDTHHVNYWYDNQDWHRLVLAMKALSEGLNVSWLISTSPRTTLDGERQIKASLIDCGVKVADSVFFNERPDDIVQRYLNLARFVVVTEDSQSMISDAVASGRPVISIRPDAAQPKESHLAFVASLERKNLLLRSTIENASPEKLASQLVGLQPYRDCWSEPVKSRLSSLLSGPSLLS